MQIALLICVTVLHATAWSGFIYAQIKKRAPQQRQESVLQLRNTKLLIAYNDPQPAWTGHFKQEGQTYTRRTCRAMRKQSLWPLRFVT